MNRKFLLIMLLLMYVGKYYSQKLEIQFDRTSAVIGQSLIVKCIIKDIPGFTPLSNLFSCPFPRKIDYCMKNCESFCDAPTADCNEIDSSIISYKCNRENINNDLIYFYTLTKLTEQIVNGRFKLDFSCSFKGQKTSDSIIVSHPVAIKTNKPKITSTFKIVVTSPPNNNNNPIGKEMIITTTNQTVISKGEVTLRMRDLIIIGLALAFITSVSINIWCCTTLFVKSCNKRKRKKKQERSMKIYEQTGMLLNSQHQTSMPQDSILPNYNEQIRMANMTPQSIYYHKRAISHPQLTHNPHNTQLLNDMVLNTMNGSLGNNRVSMADEYKHPILADSIGESLNNQNYPISSIPQNEHRIQYLNPYPHYLSCHTPYQIDTNSINNGSVQMFNSRNQLDIPATPPNHRGNISNNNNINNNNSNTNQNINNNNSSINNNHDLNSFIDSNSSHHI